MAGIQCALEGEVITEPKGKEIKNGASYATFMVVKIDQFDGSTEICKVNIFGEKARMVESRIKKGDTISAKGALLYNKWTKDGVEKSGIAVNALEITKVPNEPEEQSL